MTWGTLVAAALGATFGIGSTWLTDAIRARRDTDQRWSETKRTVYVRFLIAIMAAHGRMVAAAFRGLPEAERLRAVHDAFHADPQNVEALSVLREVAITAPDDIYRQAYDVYTQLRRLRDMLAGTSAEFRSAEYLAVNDPYDALVDALQLMMRSDLEPASPPRRFSLALTLRRRAKEHRELRPTLAEPDD